MNGETNQMDDKSGNPKYYKIDTGISESKYNSLSIFIAQRKCYQHRPDGNEHLLIDTDPSDHIEEINSHCALATDYLLEDTPITEAILRVCISKNNSPITAKDVADDLSIRWAQGTYPRDVSETTILRILSSNKLFVVSEPKSTPKKRRRKKVST